MRHLTRPEPFGNRLLSGLHRRTLQTLAPHLEPVTLARGRLLYDAGDLPPYAYFVGRGAVSLTSATKHGEAVQVGLVGSEGVVGAAEALGERRSPYRAAALVEVSALRVRGGALRSEFARAGEVQKHLIGHANSLIFQLSQAAVCARFHSAEERLCNWLLTTHDLVSPEALHFTHEGIAEMLGTARTLVSAAAGGLQQSGLIKYSRGHIRILCRDGLEARACECYRLVKEVLGRSPPRGCQRARPAPAGMYSAPPATRG